MKKSIYQSYDDLPLFLNAELIAKVLGVAPSSTYELIKTMKAEIAEMKKQAKKSITKRADENNRQPSKLR